VKPELNRRLLRKVRDHILDHPKQFFMSTFVGHKQHSCGTHGCIAGWTCLLHYPISLRQTIAETEYDPRTDDPIDFGHDAMAALGLTPEEATLMFYKWKYTQGKKAACEAACKIDTLLKDRDEFVRKYQEQYSVDDDDMGIEEAR
jgi:hypothetical protein